MRKPIFVADEETSAAIEFLAMAQRSLYRAANAAGTIEAPEAVQLKYDARHLAKTLQDQTRFAVRIRDIVRKLEVA